MNREDIDWTRQRTRVVEWTDELHISYKLYMGYNNILPKVCSQWDIGLICKTRLHIQLYCFPRQYIVCLCFYSIKAHGKTWYKTVTQKNDLCPLNQWWCWWAHYKNNHALLTFGWVQK